jgi:hypothetical protein
MRRYDVGLQKSAMRIDPDIRRCVAFIGFAAEEKDGHILPVGTCFFIVYDGVQYMVTAQHVASAIGDAPFAVRMNRKDGASNTFLVDPLEHDLHWHTKDGVDVAIIEFSPNEELYNDLDLLVLPLPTMTVEEAEDLDVEVGDLTFTIGLFRLLKGLKRNLPIVHFGHMALLASDEPVPVQDWLSPPKSGKTRNIKAHLVEQQSLQGLSGAPVFVRPVARCALVSDEPNNVGYLGLVPTRRSMLLGVWQGAWDAPPSEILATGRDMRVPVGMGVVVPISSLVNVLEMPKAKETRGSLKKRWAENSVAKSDS